MKTLADGDKCVDDNIRKMAEGQVLDITMRLCEEMKKENFRLVYEGKRNKYESSDGMETVEELKKYVRYKDMIQRYGK